MVVRTLGNSRRKFNGKNYTEYGYEFRIKDARNSAKRLRKRGWLVRIVPVEQKQMSARGKVLSHKLVHVLYRRRK